MTGVVLRGAFTREYAMQIRRPSLWLAIAVLGVMIVGSDIWQVFGPGSGHDALAPTMSRWVFEVSTWVPPVLAVLLADRLVRDRRLGIEELLESTGASRAARLWGKYLGVSAAAATPVALLWAIGVAEIALHFDSWAALPWGLVAFLAVLLPGILFVCSFALAGPTVIGVTFFRIGFVVYWIAGNLLILQGAPSLSRTWLTPIGKFARDGLLGRAYRGSDLDTGATVWAGLGSIAVIVGVACATMLAVQITRQLRAGRTA